MKRFASAVLAAATAAMCWGQPLPARAQSKDEQAIRALEERLAAAMNAKDVPAIMKGYAAGEELFVFDLGLPRQHAGWSSYKKDWQDFFDALQGAPKVEIEDLGITVRGTTAYSHSIQHVFWTNRDGSPTELNASVTDVYRKIGGQWLIVQEHLSVPIHLATGKAEMLSKP